MSFWLTISYLIVRSCPLKEKKKVTKWMSLMCSHLHFFSVGKKKLVVYGVLFGFFFLNQRSKTSI